MGSITGDLLQLLLLWNFNITITITITLFLIYYNYYYYYWAIYYNIVQLYNIVQAAMWLAGYTPVTDVFVL